VLRSTSGATEQFHTFMNLFSLLGRFCSGDSMQARRTSSMWDDSLPASSLGCFISETRKLDNAQCS